MTAGALARHLAVWSAWSAVGWCAFLVYSYPTWNALHLQVGAGAGALAGIAGMLLHGHRDLDVAADLRLVGRSWRLPLQVARDSVVVAAALVGAVRRRDRVEGAFRWIDHDECGEGRRPEARRAFLTVVGSVAPNVVVVDVGARPGRMLVHELVPERAPQRPA